MENKKTSKNVKKKKKVKKIDSRYFDYYDDVKINGRDIEW